MADSSSSLLQRIQSLTVEEFTTPCSFLIQPETSLEEAWRIMRRENIRHLPVMDSQKNVVGIISDRDIHFARSHLKRQEAKAEDFMKRDPYCASPHALISEVAMEMSANKYGSAIILDGEGGVGIFTSIDALNALIEIVRGEI